MNPTAVISIIGFVALMVVIEHSFKPRIDVTKDRDVLLWYYNRLGERVYTVLFHLH